MGITPLDSHELTGFYGIVMANFGVLLKIPVLSLSASIAYFQSFM